jgi:hypothetical protein
MCCGNTIYLCASTVSSLPFCERWFTTAQGRLHFLLGVRKNNHGLLALAHSGLQWTVVWADAHVDLLASVRSCSTMLWLRCSLKGQFFKHGIDEMFGVARHSNNPGHVVQYLTRSTSRKCLSFSTVPSMRRKSRPAALPSRPRFKWVW